MKDDRGVTPFPASSKGASRRLEAPPAEQPRPLPGQLEVVITHLEMILPPLGHPLSHRGERLALMRAELPTLSFYRYLYATVGRPWLWYERLKMNDETLRTHIHHPDVEVFVLYVSGVPAGFFELDARVADEVEVKYLGLTAEFIGRGLGGYLLGKALTRAWSRTPRRVWLNTSSLDHPKAMALYQRAGFKPFAQEVVVIDDPRLDGTFDGS